MKSYTLFASDPVPLPVTRYTYLPDVSYMYPNNVSFNVTFVPVFVVVVVTAFNLLYIIVNPG